MASKPQCANEPQYPVCPQVEEAVDEAVRKTFALFGVDVDDVESVNSFRDDLRFGRKLRRAADHGFFAVVGIVATGAVIALWTGILTIAGKGTGH